MWTFFLVGKTYVNLQNYYYLLDLLFGKWVSLLARVKWWFLLPDIAHKQNFMIAGWESGAPDICNRWTPAQGNIPDQFYRGPSACEHFPGEVSFASIMLPGGSMTHLKSNICEVKISELWILETLILLALWPDSEFFKERSNHQNLLIIPDI